MNPLSSKSILNKPAIVPPSKKSDADVETSEVVIVGDTNTPDLNELKIAPTLATIASDKDDEEEKEEEKKEIQI